MNTDLTNSVDLAAASIALDAISGTSSREVLCTALAKLGAAIGLPNFVLMHLHGADNDVAAVLHNLASPPAPEAFATQEVVKRALLSRRIPELVENVGIAGMPNCASVMWQQGMTTCVLLFGRHAPIDPQSALDILSIASLAASYSAVALVELMKAECPLTNRELECLIFAAAGCSAKETSRHLGLSSRTVEEYLLRCKDRMGVRSTLAATATALRRGWISFLEIDAASASISSRSAVGPGQRG